MAIRTGIVAPFIIFWVLLYVAREELGWKGVATCVALWTVLLAGYIGLNVSPYVFTALQSLFDAILIIVIFRGDIRIR